MTGDADEPDKTNSAPHPAFLKLVSKDGASLDSQETEGDERLDTGAPERPVQGDLPTTPREMAQELARALTKTPSASADETHNLRIIEAVLFASPVSLHESKLAAHLPEGTDIPALLLQLQDTYASRGIHLKKVAGRWMFRTADDLGHLLQREVHDERRLSKAALETLSIIAYHQPVTRAEIEEVRGVSTSSGTLDILLETNWVRMRGRRRAPGRPVTYGTTDIFLEHFGLDTIRDLPGLSELKGAGLLDPTMPANFDMPQPTDVAELLPDELPLDDEDAEDDDLFGETDDPDEADDDGGTEDRSVAPERARTTDMSQDQSEPIPSAAKDADRPTETES